MRRLLVIALLAAGLSAPAWADGAGKARVLVRASHDRDFRAVERMLDAHGYRALRSRARAGGGRVVREAAARDAVLILDADMRSRRPAVLVVVVRDLRGAVITRTRLRARNARRLRRRLARPLWQDIGPDVTRAAENQVGERQRAPDQPDPRGSEPANTPAAAPPDPQSDPQQPANAPAQSASATAAPTVSRAAAPARSPLARPPLVLSASSEVVSRSFRYRDDLYSELSNYQVAARPGIAASATWFPAAHLGLGPAWMHRIGLAGRYLFVPSFDSESADGERYDTRTASFRAGLRYSQPLGRVILSGLADYAGRSFAIEQGDAFERPPVPNVRYRLIRAGAEAHVPIGDAWAAGAALAYRHVLDAGEIASDEFFPRSSVRGVDASLWFARHLGAGFDLCAAASLERYGYSLNPEPGDFLVAGGALDQHLSASLALRYRAP